MVYNSISDAYLVIFAPNLAIQPIQFDQNSIPTWQNNSTSSTMAVWPWPHFNFQLHACLHSHPNMASEMVGKFKMTFFPILIFEFNIYFFFIKRGRQLLLRGTLFEGILYWCCIIVRCLLDIATSLTEMKIQSSGLKCLSENYAFKVQLLSVLIVKPNILVNSSN